MTDGNRTITRCRDIAIYSGITHSNGTSTISGDVAVVSKARSGRTVTIRYDVSSVRIARSTGTIVISDDLPLTAWPEALEP